MLKITRCSPLHYTKSSGSSQCRSMEVAANCSLPFFVPHCIPQNALHPSKRISGNSYYGVITCNWQQYIRWNTAKPEKAAVGTWQDNRQKTKQRPRVHNPCFPRGPLCRFRGTVEKCLSTPDFRNCRTRMGQSIGRWLVRGIRLRIMAAYAGARS